MLAGLAVVVEFPLAVVALVLGLYAAAGSRPVRRGASYAAGVLVGVLPLLAYNTWAFGSPTTLGYTNALKQPVGSDAPVVGANAEGFYGVGLPDVRAALSLLVSEKGLMIVTPLAVVGLVGLPLLWRSGRRPETLVCTAIPSLFLAYNAAYYLPFGGQAPGPRFLIPAMPFLALPLALALKARPLVVAGVGVASTAVMALATIAGPLTGVEYGIGTWLDRLGSADLVETLPGRLGLGPEWLAALPFAILIVVALVLALARLPLRDARVLRAAAARRCARSVAGRRARRTRSPPRRRGARDPRGLDCRPRPPRRGRGHAPPRARVGNDRPPPADPGARARGSPVGGATPVVAPRGCPRAGDGIRLVVPPAPVAPN